MSYLPRFCFALTTAAISALLVQATDVTADDLAASNDAAPKVIHVHHHHYYGYGAFGPQRTSTVSQASMFTPGYHPWLEANIRPWDIDWGKLGFKGFFGKQGDHMGLIVSNVDKGSPAEQFGLVPGDMIVSIDGDDISDSSYRELEAMFASITIKPKTALTMTVWNTHTRRTHTLKAELVEDDR